MEEQCFIEHLDHLRLISDTDIINEFLQYINNKYIISIIHE